MSIAVTLRRSPLLLILLLFFQAVPSRGQSSNPVDYAVELSAQIQTSPPQITVNWVSDADATGYTVLRKVPTDTSWTTLTVSSLSASATNYTDSNVAVGTEYEYQVVKTASGYSGYGFISVGIETPLVQSRGKIILLVDNTQSAALAASLAQLQQDLVGDGWTVLYHEVSRSAAVTDIKALILSDYNSDTVNVNTLYLFGHVPVPYSGDFAPDGHPDHVGAWPDDSYYGDFSGTYTDSTVDETTAADVRNYNIPGDGKFDQSAIPGFVQLRIGRVDMSNLSDFNQTETQLLQQYLNKAHAFRNKQWTINQTGLIDDQFGLSTGEPFAADGWKNFSALVGPTNTVNVANVPNDVNNGLYNVLQDPSQSTLWIYGCGGGSPTNAGSIVYTNTFAGPPVYAVFSCLFGSYFGDFDYPNDLLRAPLANGGYGLTDVWAGRPFWYFHHMGQGHPIGYSAQLTQNNASLYPAGEFPQGVHIALMGDPTLRMAPVAPPTAVTATHGNGTVVDLKWTASTDAVAGSGYNVYRSTSLAGPFLLLNTTGLVTATNYSDPASPAGGAIYEVRTVILQQGNSGSYWNASQGVFQVVDLPTVTVTAPISVASSLGTNAAKLLFTRTGIAASDLALTYKLGGTAKNGVDYASLSGGVTVPAGSSTASILVTAMPSSSKVDKTLTVTLDPAITIRRGSPDAATITLVDTAQDFAPYTGVYQGAVSSETLAAGGFSVTLNAAGSFTASLRIGAARYSFVNKLDQTGQYTGAIPGLTGVTLALALDLTNDTGTIAGTITQSAKSVGTFTAAHAFVGPTPFGSAGTYTVAIQPGTPASGSGAPPDGAGYGTVHFDTHGNGRFVGRLGDGTSVTLGNPVTNQSAWLVCSSLYTTGWIIGSVQFADVPSVSDLAGSLSWSRPASTKKGAVFFPAGFSTQISFVGAQYVAPPAGSPLFNFPSGGVLSASGDNLNPSLTESVAISDRDVVTYPSGNANKLVMHIDRAAGLITGTFSLAEPNLTVRTVRFASAVLPKQNSAFGYFLDSTQTGLITIGPLP